MSQGGPMSSDATVARARKMFARVLSQWAMDLMELRRTGLDAPVVRDGSADLVTPSLRAGAFGGRWSKGTTSGLLAWRAPGRRAA